jgi:hypothetical protein
MLRCSKCGTINADGNSFCSSCGAKLNPTSIKCPECGTLNAIGNIFCSKCHSKLISPADMIPPEEEDITTTPVKGISLPTRSDSAEETPMPDWLQQLTDDVAAKSMEEPPEESDTELTSEEPTNYELPDWLSREAEQSPEQTNDAAENIQDALESTEEDGASTEGIPDWLSAIADEIDAAAATPSNAPEVPDWLSSIAEEAGTNATSEPGQPLPDWLKPGSKRDADAAEQTSGILKEHVDDNLVPTPGIPPESDEDVPEEILEGSEQPKSLLKKLGKEISSAEFDSVETPQKDVLLSQTEKEIEQTGADIDLTPDWLSIPVEDFEDTSAKEQLVGEEEAEFETEIPDWLSELGEKDQQVDQISTPKLSTQTIDDQENLPTWLSEIDISHEQPVETQAVFTDESIEPTPTETQTEEIPSWLDEVTPPSDIIAIRPAAPAFIPENEETDLKSDEESLDLEPVDAESIPSWLNELRLPQSETDTTSLDEDADFSVAPGELFGGIEGILASDADNLARAEVPEWLHDLKPPTGTEWPPLATLPATEALEVEEITPAEVPDWVQSLRPKPGEQIVKTPERLLPTEPAEIEGPLASIDNILPSSTTIDMPADYEANLMKIPENVIQQAKLWQQLLAQPRSDVRRVIKRETATGLGSTFLRIIVSAILVLGSLAALWLLPVSNLAVTAAEGKAPGVQKFVDSVDALLPGETVILAVEYGWAQSEEMTAIANAVLRHLRDQEVQIAAVSTMPEGTSIIPILLQNHQLTNLLPGSQSYLPGYVSGIAGFLNGPEAQSASMLIILSSNFERTRWWLEQNQTAWRPNGKKPLTVNTGVSAATGPMTSPYLDGDYTPGSIIGFQDSMNYQALRGLQIAENIRMLNVLLVMHWVAIILLTIGFLYILAAGKKRAA